MLDFLHEIELRLPNLLRSEKEWSDLLIDYHPPIVERLWRDIEGHRVYLHRIHPCGPEDALFHPHPWPSAIRVISGRYEMAVGFGPGDNPPPEAAKLVLPAGSEYQMINPDGWHYVRPLDFPSLSVMVTGQPWQRPSPKSEKPLKPLGDLRRAELFGLFRNFYL